MLITGDIICIPKMAQSFPLQTLKTSGEYRKISSCHIRVHVMIEEIQGTVFGNFGSHLIRIWGVGDGLERKCSRRREKLCARPGAKRM